MHVTLLGQPKAESKPKVNPESYNLVLRAGQFLYKLSGDDFERALELYRKTASIDPSDARAWAGIGLTLGSMAGFGAGSVQEAMTDGMAAVHKALELDDSLPEAHVTMGWMSFAYFCDWEQAGKSFRRGVALAPGSTVTLIGLATYEAAFGDINEGLRLARQALESDPLDAAAHLHAARAQLWARQYDAAYATYSRALELSPNMNSVYFHRATVRLLQGRAQEALAEAEREQTDGYRACALASVYHDLGDRSKSDAEIAKIVAGGEHWGIQVTSAYAYRNDLDLAYAWLERSYAAHDAGVAVVRRSPMFANMKNDPRWDTFWAKTGVKPGQ